MCCVYSLDFVRFQIFLLQRGLDRIGQLQSQERRHRIPYLGELLLLISHKLEPIGETLKPSGFVYGDSSSPAVWQPHALHVACRASQVSAGECPSRLVGM